jgi:hypothetical protein
MNSHQLRQYVADRTVTKLAAMRLDDRPADREPPPGALGLGGEGRSARSSCAAALLPFCRSMLRRFGPLGQECKVAAWKQRMDAG